MTYFLTMRLSNFILKMNFLSMFGLLSCSLIVAAFSTPALARDTHSKALFPDLASQQESIEVKAQGIQALESRMQQFVSDGDVLGISTLLVKDGNVLSYTKAGVSKLLEGQPIVDDTIYRIYSMTKPVTAVALMMLWEEGHLRLDDPVSKYIPEFADLKVLESYTEDGQTQLQPLTRQPTIKELLSHTAGFAYGLYGTDPANSAFRDNAVLASPDLTTFIERTAQIPLLHQPGEQWYYSVAVDIQGAIVERISGQSFGEFLRSKIFKPLNMPDTGFYVPDEKLSRLADVFAYHPETQKLTRMPFVEPKYNILGDISFAKGTTGMESGGGGLVSTMADYARFCQMLLNGGELNGVRLLKPETIKLMRTNVLEDHQGVSISGTLSDQEARALGFGLGFGTIRSDEQSSIDIGGDSYFWGGAAGTWFWVDPTNNLFFIGMIQRFSRGGPEVDFRQISRELVYRALTEEP